MHQTFFTGERSEERAGQSSSRYCLHERITLVNVCYRDVTVRSVKGMLVRCLSSRLLITAGRWDPSQRSVWSSYTHQFHILLTAMGSRPTRAAILRSINHNPGRLEFNLYQTLFSKHFFFYTRHQNNFLLHSSREAGFSMPGLDPARMISISARPEREIEISVRARPGPKIEIKFQP